jgi:hypothetical protein
LAFHIGVGQIVEQDVEPRVERLVSSLPEKQKQLYFVRQQPVQFQLPPKMAAEPACAERTRGAQLHFVQLDLPAIGRFGGQGSVVGLGEWHRQFPLDSELRIALVRHPGFARKVRTIVVEFASAAEQSTPGRYITGEHIDPAKLELI